MNEQELPLIVRLTTVLVLILAGWALVGAFAALAWWVFT